MSPEMYTIIGVGVGLSAVIVALFAATWQMMNSRFSAFSADVGGRFSTTSTDVNGRFASLSNDVNARFDSLSNDFNARFDSLSNDMNARFKESNDRFLLLVEQNRQLIAEISQLSQRVARLEGLLRVPHETDGHSEG